MLSSLWFRSGPLKLPAPGRRARPSYFTSTSFSRHDHRLYWIDCAISKHCPLARQRQSHRWCFPRRHWFCGVIMSVGSILSVDSITLCWPVALSIPSFNLRLRQQTAVAGQSVSQSSTQISIREGDEFVLTFILRYTHSHKLLTLLFAFSQEMSIYRWQSTLGVWFSALQLSKIRQKVQDILRTRNVSEDPTCRWRVSQKPSQSLSAYLARKDDWQRLVTSYRCCTPCGSIVVTNN